MISLRLNSPLALIAGMALLVITVGCDTSSGPGNGLPPDPGPAGDATLEGIDTDRDGIRDDVQRLVFGLDTRPDVRAKLGDLARAHQDLVLAAASGASTESAHDAVARAVRDLAAADSGNAVALSVQLRAGIANTTERARAQVAANAERSGTVGPDFEGGNKSGSSVAYVFFGNGVNNDENETELNRLRLQTFMRESGELPSGYDVRFLYAYNTHENLLYDLIEAAPQAGGDSYRTFLLAVNGIIPMPEGLRAWYEDYIASVNEDVWADEEDVRAHTDLYSALIGSGNTVLVVAHSQGNFFANEACRRLDSPSFGMVGVASPASSVCGAREPYTTNSDDLVINLFAGRANWSTLPITTGSTIFSGDLLGHSFDRSYLQGRNSGPRIAAHVREQLLSLQAAPRIESLTYDYTGINNCQLAESGATGSTSSWRLSYTDGDGDVGSTVELSDTFTFEGGSSGFFTFTAPRISGNGRAGVVEFELCSRFGDSPRTLDQIRMKDLAGNESSPWNEVRDRPSGADLTGGPSESAASHSASL